MTLYKNGAFVADQWRTVEEGEDVPPSGHVIMPLDWWKAERQIFDGSNAPLGLRIEPGTPIEDYAEDLSRLSLIALVFPKFGDGRHFSTAQLLRTRYGFKGEIRAVGEVLIDQIQMMERCGFDAFEIRNAATEEALREQSTPRYSHFYQPGVPKEAPAGTRPWLRKVAQA
jgi:phosphoadenosine phosphosulfate reductase